MSTHLFMENWRKLPQNYSLEVPSLKQRTYKGGVIDDNSLQFSIKTWGIHYLFVLRFYGPVNPMGSCRARSVYLTTRLLGRLSPLSG